MSNNKTPDFILADIAAHARRNGAYPESIPAIQRELASSYSLRSDGYVQGPNGVNAEAYMQQWLAAHPHYMKPKTEATPQQESAPQQSEPQQQQQPQGNPWAQAQHYANGGDAEGTRVLTNYINARMNAMINRGDPKHAEIARMATEDLRTHSRKRFGGGR